MSLIAVELDFLLDDSVSVSVEVLLDFCMVFDFLKTFENMDDFLDFSFFPSFSFFWFLGFCLEDVSVPTVAAMEIRTGFVWIAVSTLVSDVESSSFAKKSCLGLHTGADDVGISSVANRNGSLSSPIISMRRADLLLLHHRPGLPNFLIELPARDAFLASLCVRVRFSLASHKILASSLLFSFRRISISS